ncbi:hypothetical protein DFH09DRAFT_1208147 [Mycena vulgaris]|nr:hypothetical protein DFH09DRAFT_1208147 [Mycena vulgaris]
MVPCFSVGVALILHAFLAARAFAASINITIDDTNSTVWTFVPVGNWSAVTPATPCPGCFAQPDPTLAHNSTWHDGTVVSGSCTFQGSAIYIYGIDLAATSGTNISFNMNDRSKTGFHYYGESASVYNSLFFSATNLDSSVAHTVTWIGQTNFVGSGAMLFDYAVITVDQEDTSSSSVSSTPAPSSTAPSSSGTGSPTGSPTPTHKSKTGPIVGAVVGVVGGLAILVAVFLFLRRRRASVGQANIDTGNYPPRRISATGISVNPYQPVLTNERRETSYIGAAVSSPSFSTGPAPPVSTASSPPPAISMASPTPESKSPPVPVILTWDPNAESSRDSQMEERLRHLEALVPPPEYRNS